MPRATVDLSSTERYELKSCPPDGFVVLKRLNYGDKLRRQDIYMQMQMRIDSKGSAGDLSMSAAAEKVAQFEFARCVVDHNLEDESGRKLDFKSPADVIRLDPRIGEEINGYLTEMNNFDQGDDAANFNSESDQP
jgi:hypothetical protein